MRFSLKHLLALTTAVAVLLLLLMPFRVFLPSFYYQEFNATKARLENIPKLKVLDYWQHKDITLEDCGFDIEVDGVNASLTFFDSQNWIGLFDRIDGIAIRKGEGQIWLSRQKLNQAGFEVVGLGDVLEKIRAISEFCENSKGPEFTFENVSKKSGFKSKYWMRIKMVGNQ